MAPIDVLDMHIVILGAGTMPGNRQLRNMS